MHTIFFRFCIRKNEHLFGPNVRPCSSQTHLQKSGEQEKKSWAASGFWSVPSRIRVWTATVIHSVRKTMTAVSLLCAAGSLQPRTMSVGISDISALMRPTHLLIPVINFARHLSSLMKTFGMTQMWIKELAKESSLSWNSKFNPRMTWVSSFSRLGDVTDLKFKLKQDAPEEINVNPNPGSNGNCTGF